MGKVTFKGRRQPRPDDPMFGKTFIVFLNDPAPASEIPADATGIGGKTVAEDVEGRPQPDAEGRR